MYNQKTFFVFLIAFLASCGSGGGGGGGGTTPTPPGSSTCTPIVGGETPCINTNGSQTIIGDQILTRNTSNASNTAVIYNSVTKNGNPVVPIAVTAGSSQIIFGDNPNDIGSAITGANSNLNINLNPRTLSNVSFSGTYAQVSYDNSSVSSDNFTGNMNMTLNGAAGTLLVSGDESFSINGQTLVWDDRLHQFIYVDTNSNASAILFGSTEILGHYTTSEETNTATGVFGGVAQ